MSDALEKLGYVKQEDERDFDTLTYCRDSHVYVETITIHPTEKEYCKTFNTWDSDYISFEEHNAITEILREGEK